MATCSSQRSTKREANSAALALGEVSWMAQMRGKRNGAALAVANRMGQMRGKRSGAALTAGNWMGQMRGKRNSAALAAMRRMARGYRIWRKAGAGERE